MSENWIFVDFGSFAIYWYAVFMVLAAAAASRLFVLSRRWQGEDASRAWNTALCAMPAALIGSRIFYGWFGVASFTGGWRDFLDLSSGGYAFYGAAGGILLALAISAAVRKESFVRLLDAAIVPLAAALVIVRIAGITSGEDMGFPVQTDSPGKLPFLIWSEAEQSWNVWVGFFEGIAAAVILAVCAVFFASRYVRHGKGARDGDTTLLFMMMYGLSQSVFESMRNDSLFMVTLGFVKISEIVSVVMAVAAFVIVAVRYGRVRKNARGLVISCACYAVLLTAAVICEFKMNAVDLMRNYVIMSVSLGLMLVISFRLLLSGRSVAEGSGDGVPAKYDPVKCDRNPRATAGHTSVRRPPVTSDRKKRRSPSRGGKTPEMPLNDSETVF